MSIPPDALGLVIPARKPRSIDEGLRAARLTEDSLLEALIFVSETRPSAVKATLPDSELDHWRRYSGVDLSSDADSLSLRHVLENVPRKGEVLTTEEAARILGVNPSRVRQRILDLTLYAIPGEGRGVPRRLPSWQFRDGEAIPHLREVLQAVPREYGPIEIGAFFTNAVVDSPGREERATVADWLFGGGEIEPVVSLAESLGYSL